MIIKWAGQEYLARIYGRDERAGKIMIPNIKIELVENNFCLKRSDMKIDPLGSSGTILTCYRFLTSMYHFPAKTQQKTIDKPYNSSKQSILSVISFYFAPIQTFECIIRSFSELFSPKKSDLGPKSKKSDH